MLLLFFYFHFFLREQGTKSATCNLSARTILFLTFSSMLVKVAIKIGESYCLQVFQDRCFIQNIQKIPTPVTHYQNWSMGQLSGSTQIQIVTLSKRKTFEEKERRKIFSFVTFEVFNVLLKVF